MKHLYVRKFSQFGNSKKVLFLNFLFFSLILSAQNYPESIPLSSINYTSYQYPTGDTPGYLEVKTNGFSNEVIRISDAGVLGTSGQNLRHHYSKDQPWNSDGSLIKLAGYPAAILDGETFEFLYWASIPSAATWSNINPNLMYGTSGNRIVRFDVTTNIRETLHTFSEFSSVSYGYGEGNTSNDDKYIGLIGKNGSNQTLIVYNIKDNVVVATRSIGTLDLDWFSISPLGNYAVISYGPDGSNVDQGLKVYDIDLTNYRHLNNYTTHADIGLDANGDEVYIAFGDPTTRSNGYYLKMVRLSDGQVTPFFYHSPGHGVWGGHISTRNTDRPGWAYISEGCCQTVGYKEMFAIKLDGSDMIERFGIHHSNENTGYGHEAHGVPNRDGSKMMFASNWANAFTENFPPAFIVQAPQSSLGVEDETLATSDIKVYPNPSRDGLVNIKLNGSIAVKAIEVHDMLGRLIRTDQMDSSEKSLNLSNLPTGVYLLTFQTERSGSITKRIVLN